MRVKSIVITSLVLASLFVLCMTPGYAMELSQPKMKPLFDMSSTSWSPNTYPAFSGSSLYNAQSPTLPTASGTDMGKVSGVNYSPIFDMSPGAWTFNSYPAFRSDSGKTGTSLFGKLFS